MLLCILFMYVLMVWGLVFVASYMTRMSSMYRVENAIFLVSKNCFTFTSS
jgi:hypothetical protein